MAPMICPLPAFSMLRGLLDAPTPEARALAGGRWGRLTVSELGLAGKELGDGGLERRFAPAGVPVASSGDGR